MNSYRVEYTEVFVNGEGMPVPSMLTNQCELVRGALEDVRAYLDSRHIWSASPITITEYTKSDSMGRVVPASEWDV